MQQYLVIGLGAFGAEVIERLRALPVERNIVYHPLACDPAQPVEQAYLSYRQRLLDVLNREVFNFANTPLTIYLVGLLVEEHMAANLMHLGYLFKTFFRENIIVSPRVKLVTAFPTIIPEEAYAWLGETRRVLERIDTYAALKEPFRPSYPEVKRPLPQLSGPPFEETTFCYCESLDAEDLDVSTQAAATRIYFDVVLLPERSAQRADLAEFHRRAPAGQGFAPVSGCAVAFLPALAKLIRDEVEYALLLRLVEAFLSGDAPEPSQLDGWAEPLLRKLEAARARDLVEAIVRSLMDEERWFDLAAIDPVRHYDIEMSPPADAFLQSHLAAIERDRTRFTQRVRDAAVERLAALPVRLLALIREAQPRLALRSTDALLTRAQFQLSQRVAEMGTLAQSLRREWESAREGVAERTATLKQIVSARDAQLKRGSATDARVKEALAAVDVPGLLRRGLAATVAEALAEEKTVEERLRAAYDKIHDRLGTFLARREEILTHLSARRESFLKRRELHLYVFNQIFRRRILDGEIARAMAEASQATGDESLGQAMGAFFFKSWFDRPDAPWEEIERGLTDTVAQKAQREVERLAAGLRIDYAEILPILREIIAGQAGSIFDSKYKEHPQAAYRQAQYLYHRDELPGLGAPAPEDGVDLTDVARIPELPFQVLELLEIQNLPFRALRQYASFERAAE
jgi:hypothetical protein